MIVNKPQFDTDSINTGDAMIVYNNKGFSRFDKLPSVFNSIVQSVNPLKIGIVYIENGSSEVKSLFINIDDVIGDNPRFKMVQLVPSVPLDEVFFGV